MDLVIQAPAIAPDDLASLVALAQPVEVTSEHAAMAQAYRLHRVVGDAAIGPACERAGVDHALVAEAFTRDRVRLVAMDMDSTLITIECIDEIADFVGIKPQVAAITASSMRGEIDFRESLTRRVGLLAGLGVEALQRVYDERLRLSPGAETMLAGFKAVGARTLLVSGGFTFFTDRLKARLGLDETVSNTLEIVDGRLTGRIDGAIVDAEVKAARFSALRNALCADGGIAVAIGDGANDLPMLRAADFSVAYRAKPIVRRETSCAIDRCGLDAALNLFG